MKNEEEILFRFFFFCLRFAAWLQCKLPATADKGRNFTAAYRYAKHKLYVYEHDIVKSCKPNPSWCPPTTS